MMNICPEYANIEEDGVLMQVDPDDVEVGTIIVVKPGERIPLDGIVTEGTTMIDTAALTGESVPRRATVGDEIISGCVNGSSTIKVKVTKASEDSTVARILELVENASSKKAKVENFITKICQNMSYTGCHHRCSDLSYFTSVDLRRWLGRLDPESMYLFGYFLPVCTCHFCSAWFLRWNRCFL